MATIQTEQELASWRRPLLLGLCLVIVVVVLGVWVWSGPRAHVEVPGSDATPEQVVLAYAAAVNARDFDTVNAIDARDGETPGRFSRTRRLDNVEIKSVTRSGDQVHVTFYADFSGWDISLPDGRDLWGYVLQRGEAGRWQIVDAGVV